MVRRVVAHVFVEDLELPVLSSGDFHHLSRVLRLQAGEPVTASDGRGGVRLCSWAGSPTLHPIEEISRVAAATPTLTIALSIVKGERPEWAVQKLTEVGVDRVVLMTTARSVVRWGGLDRRRGAGGAGARAGGGGGAGGDAGGAGAGGAGPGPGAGAGPGAGGAGPGAGGAAGYGGSAGGIAAGSSEGGGHTTARQVERLREVARNAAMQSRRAWLPTVEGPVAFAEFVASASGELAGATDQPGFGFDVGLGLGAGPPQAAGLALAVPGGGPPTLANPVVLIGPEGGWSEDELAAVPCRVGLSSQVLRAETAAVAAGVLLSALRSGLVAPAE
ncbi:MAG TPA: RsmE family RNA methyltransferase [Acidimicrobiales bacterium]|nr:RsmE family RNA methyltransferase [Acidimicrobiales bacterium]